jgi:hypothetical protein
VLAYHKDVVVDNLSSKNRLPVSHIVDTQGQLKFTFSGRIPAQAWDSIAELLP